MDELLLDEAIEAEDTVPETLEELHQETLKMFEHVIDMVGELSAKVYNLMDTIDMLAYECLYQKNKALLNAPNRDTDKD